MVLSLIPLYCSFNIAELQASTSESVIHGHHIYKQIWWLLVREILTLKWEDATVVSHVPRESSLVWLFHFLTKLLPSTSSSILSVLRTT